MPPASAPDDVEFVAATAAAAAAVKLIVLLVVVVAAVADGCRFFDEDVSRSSQSVPSPWSNPSRNVPEHTCCEIEKERKGEREKERETWQGTQGTECNDNINIINFGPRTQICSAECQSTVDRAHPCTVSVVTRLRGGG